MTDGAKRGRGRPVGGKRAALAIALACGAPNPEHGKKVTGSAAAIIDPRLLQRLAKIQCTVPEAASVLGVTHATLKHRLSRDPALQQIWESGRDYGKASLRRLQWKYAKAGNGPGAQVLIHLSKHWLGQSDKSLMELTGKDGKPLTVDNETLLARLKELSTQELQQLESTARKLGGSVPLRLVPRRSA